MTILNIFLDFFRLYIATSSGVPDILVLPFPPPFIPPNKKRQTIIIIIIKTILEIPAEDETSFDT